MVTHKRKAIRVRKSISYRYYICSCGQKIIPISNPSRCPNCGKITFLKG